ncbi:phage late control D family protein [Paenibacillus thiaminolyticus]|uniref:Phage late control D family protein n=1 Tax=Paenibacillus thiaminolyticus TaxID=49283 RepID=A0ABT4G3U9_PANTH|nr:contractile injection system protein, VgrG/Pvc8 family [Paenibacillus thiaminolyticus]MCY9535524.1 phage late control D family protein [Paenibacillus thiaminolyticus]MCY9601703.1 phage late control D family protein [Paenibacillus thiaminolyticus]MCY9610741.1 phage late control D family protein [Paenibacillus thiaminolyticus]MCY9615846.1 phage late control D family protein [Paenibacillus thiaminolyticus]MCY9622150.1 phage late control D family protein [Paenibacillus thiaminolyticus]
MSVLHDGIGYESLRFYGSFQPQHIEKLQITRTINDHAYLTVSGMLSEEQGAACIGQNMEEEPIVIRQLDEQGQSRRRLFHGIVTRLSVHCIRGVYTFELEAASHSYQMDIRIKKRSYQDIHRTYADLVTTMIRKYKYGDAIDTLTNDAKLGAFVLQYEETDWAFLQRLASRFGSVLVPEVTAASPKVFFGIPEGKRYKVERNVSCQVRRTFHELERGKPGKHAGSYVTYVIENLEYYALGDIIALPIGSGKELIVVRAVTRLEDGLLRTRYDLQAEQDIRLARYENDQATGIALTGSVLKVHQDLVQLQLDIDPKQDPEKACWFPVATRYVAEEHSGWYDMPEVGERVELYLPTSREQEAYVMDSRQHRHAQGEPDVKVWRHTQGSGVNMSEQELTLSTSGALSITLHEGNGITVSSPGDVQIQGGHVKLDAGQELSLTAGSALYLTGGASCMVLDGETDIKAPVVNQEGTVKAPVFVMDLPPVPEPPLMNVKDYEAAQAAAREGSTTNNAKTPTAKITSPADQKRADGLLSTESKLLGSIPVIGAVAGGALGGLAGAAVSVSLLASAAVPVRSTGTSRAGGAQGGLHPLKYLASLVMQGLISQYEHEKAKDAYYRKWLLGKVFTSARELGTPTSWNDLASYVQRMAQSANELEQAYHQIPSDLRQRWKANYERYMAEQPKPELCRVKEDNRNLFEKSWDSICELGKGAYEAAAERNEKKFDSIGSFLDYISSGIPKAMFTSYMDRAEHWLDSPADAANHLTFGIHGMIRGAMFPKEVASPEHWADLLGTSGWVVGGPVTKGLIKSPQKMLQAPKVGERTSPKINKPKYGVVPKSGGSTVNWGQAKTFINERFEALQKSAGQLSKNKLAYDGPSANYKSSTQKPLEPTKNQIEVRKYYPGSNPENSASGSTLGKNKKSSGEGTGKIEGMPPIVQSRVNLRNGSAEEGAGFNHVLDRHFNPSKNASQFSITPDELKGVLQSKEVVNTPVSRVLYSDIKLANGTIEKQARYVREVTLDCNIGIDKFSGSPTNIMTVLTDKYGNLVTATPGVIK